LLVQTALNSAALRVFDTPPGAIVLAFQSNCSFAWHECPGCAQHEALTACPCLGRRCR
jgi:hypothetical protein